MSEYGLTVIAFATVVSVSSIGLGLVFAFYGKAIFYRLLWGLGFFIGFAVGVAFLGGFATGAYAEGETLTAIGYGIGALVVGSIAGGLSGGLLVSLFQLAVQLPGIIVGFVIGYTAVGGSAELIAGIIGAIIGAVISLFLLHIFIVLFTAAIGGGLVAYGINGLHRIYIGPSDDQTASGLSETVNQFFFETQIAIVAFVAVIVLGALVQFAVVPDGDMERVTESSNAQ